mgnify:CR=1 FL=1
MPSQLSNNSINRDARGSIPMIDPIEERTISIKQRIAQFKKDHPEIYKDELNEKDAKSEFWKLKHSIK